MLTDKSNVLELASLLSAHGIHHIVLCPGSRNIPMTHTFSAMEEMHCYAITDERSAGFFALGLALQSGKPAAVCCTSGTALLNLHPAMAEARYQKVPLLVLSADRPAAWIDQMDGQTLVQPGVFSQLGIHSVNIPEIRTKEEQWHANRLIHEAFSELESGHPAHINLPLSEPLFNFTEKELPATRTIHLHHFSPSLAEVQEKCKEMDQYEKILLVCGQYNHPDRSYHLPSHITCLSEHIGNGICDQSITDFDQILSSLEGDEKRLDPLVPDLIITLGGHLVSKRFKQFIRQHPPKAHWQIDPEGKITDLFCCLSEVIQISPEIFLSALEGKKDEKEDSYAQLWRELSQKIDEPALDFSETGAIGQLIHQLPVPAVLHLANSSAIRYAQLFPIRSGISVQCNRGTSGIEGSLSTAVGYAALSQLPNFVIIGDLSFFYDANALWNQHVNPQLRVLLVNNGGGEIFKNLKGREAQKESEPFILGNHQTSARAWTEGMGWEYLSARKQEELETGIRALTSSGHREHPLLLEVFTDSEKDTVILKEYYNQLKNK